MDTSNLFDEYGELLLLIILVVFLGGILTICYKSINADGKITYCYVDSDNGVIFRVYGFRPWRSDQQLGWESSGEKAEDLKKKVCPVK